jgi:hypothetical protein
VFAKLKVVSFAPTADQQIFLMQCPLSISLRHLSTSRA